MTGDTEERLASMLARHADELTVGDVPLAAIGRESARRGRRQRRMVLGGVGVVAAAALVSAGLVATDGANDPDPARPVPSMPSYYPTGPSVPEWPPDGGGEVSAPPQNPARREADRAAVAAAMAWPTRGSLRGDPQLLAQVRDRVWNDPTVKRSTAMQPPPQTELAVWYAADTPAGRVIVVGYTVRMYPDATVPAHVLVLAGPTGASPAQMQVVGSIGEALGSDLTLSRLIPDERGGWWLFALAAPGTNEAQVSWYPRYGPRGREPREWTGVAVDDGIVLAAAPGRTVTARLTLSQGGVRTVDTPVVEDSDQLNDPSFLPSEPDLSPDPDVKAWATRRISLLTGVPADRLTVRELASSGTREGHASHLLTVRLPGAALLVVLVQETPAQDAPADRTLHVAVAPAAVAGADAAGGNSDAMVASRLWAWRDSTRIVAAAPFARNESIRVRYGATEVATGTLDGAGFADLSTRSTTGKSVTVEVSQTPGIWLPGTDPDADPHSDPFDLRD